MGGGFYSTANALNNRISRGYTSSKSFSEVSEQTRKRQIHPLMDPAQAKVREARDSQDHPHTVPIIIALDMTGSMGRIPHLLIQDGLPTLMSTLIQRGVKDAAVLFLPIGDHEVDDAPLQVAQFESNDEKLDDWLVKSFLEGGGGGNAGESYLLAWYYAANHVVTDAWEKRGQKGFLITIGDEPNLQSLPGSAIRAIMGEGQQNYTADELQKAAEEKWHVFHIHTNGSRHNAESQWRDKLKQHFLIEYDYTKIPALIAETIYSRVKDEGVTPLAPETPGTSEDEPKVKPHL